MSNVLQHFPITPAIAYDGNFDLNPLLTDFNANDIGIIIPCQYVDPSDGARRSGYEMTYWDSKSIRYVPVLFPGINFATIDDFINYVFSCVADASETLKKYTGLKRINFYKNVSGSPSFAANQYKVKRRDYIPSKNETDLAIDLGNTIQLDIYTVAGDQTLAKGYYYTGSL